MRVLILQQVAMHGQMLSPGVEVDVDEIAAAWLIESGAAQALDASMNAASANPVLDGALDVPPSPPRRRARAEG